MEHEPERGDVRTQYANYFQVGYNAVEFLVDFGRHFADTEERVHTRIITNPTLAKALLELLRRSIEEYEERFGLIPKESDP